MSGPNPFPGLRSFDYEESHLFFGREKHVDDLLKKLDQNHFVAIVGTSGSGKSSLVRAGLLPAMRKERGSEDNSPWIITTMKPGNAPVENMGRSLTSIDEFKSDETDQFTNVTDSLNASSLGLVQVVRKVLPQDRKLLILLDQFEETFRYSGSGKEVNDEQSEKFVRLIIDAIRQRDVPIYVILTIRSDFLGDCARFEGLPEAINDGHYLVPRLTTEQNKSVITGPVNYAQGKISPRLVQKLLNDLGDNPDQLPVLQHALMRTWDKWTESSEQGEPMDLRHYEMTGTMEHALSYHADEAFEELDGPQKDLIEKIFKALTVRTGESRGVRRPTSVRSLAMITESPSQKVIDALEPFRKSGRTFILPAEGINVNEDTIVDISHESLMRSWERLRKWVDEEALSAELYERLCMSASLHEQGMAALWRDPELQVAIEWLSNEKPNKAWASQYNEDYEKGMKFLQSSEKARSREQAASKRTRILVRSAIAIFMVTVSSLTVWALFQTRKANENFREAQLQTREAINQKQLAEKSEEMALEASRNALDAKEFAELQSNIAQEQKQLAEVQKQRAESEASRALEQEQYAIQQKELAEQKSEEAFREKQRAETSQTEANRLRMIELSQNLAFKSQQVTGDPQLKTLLAHEAIRLSADNKGNLDSQQLYAAAYDAVAKSDRQFTDIRMRENSKIEALKAGRGKLWVVVSSGMINHYNSNDLKKVQSVKVATTDGSINTAYFSNDSQHLIAGDDKNNAVFQNTGGGNIKKLSGHDGLVRAAAFVDNGKLVATGGRDSSVIWYSDGISAGNVKLKSRIKALAFLGNSDKLLAGCDDGNVFSINTQNKKITRFANSHGARVQSIEVSENGQMAVVGYSSGVVTVFDGQGNQVRTMKHDASADHLVLDTRNRIVAVGTARPSIFIYNIDESSVKPIIIRAVNSPITDMDISAPFIYVSCKDRTVRTYPLHTEYFRDLLERNLSRDLTKEEWNTYIGDDVPYRKSAKR